MLSMKRIVVLKGKSLYDVLRKAADIMATRWRNLGYEVAIYDLADSSGYQSEQEQSQAVLDAVFSNDTLFVYVIQAHGFDVVDENNKPIFDRAGCPIVGQIVDTPIIHVKRLNNHFSDNIYIGCVDKKHVSMVKKYFPGVAHPYFMPHRGFLCQNKKPWSERSMDVFFPGSYHSYEEEIAQLQELPEPYRTMGLQLVNDMLDNEKLAYEEGVSNAVYQMGYQADKNNMLLIMSALYPAYRAIHEFYRTMAVSELLAAGIHVTVCGRGWQNFSTEYPRNLTIIEGRSINEIAELMGDAKIVLNVCPVFTEGAHERIFTAMLAGAVCLTDENDYIHEILSDNVKYYNVRKMELLPEMAKEILLHSEAAETHTEKAYRLAYDKYRWENEADEVLEMLGL